MTVQLILYYFVIKAADVHDSGLFYGEKVHKIYDEDQLNKEILESKMHGKKVSQWIIVKYVEIMICMTNDNYKHAWINHPNKGIPESMVIFVEQKQNQSNCYSWCLLTPKNLNVSHARGCTKYN